jgi:hypothetical protein
MCLPSGLQPYIFAAVTYEGPLEGAAEAVAHTLLSREPVPGPEGVADFVKLALLHLIRAVLGRLFRRAARGRFPGQNAANPQLAGASLVRPRDAAQAKSPARKLSAPQTSLMSLLPDSLQFRLRLVALPKPRAPTPPRSPPAEPPSEPAQPKHRWETLGRYRLGPPPTNPPEPETAPETAAAAAPPRRLGRSRAPVPAAPPVRPNDAGGRPRPPQPQALFSGFAAASPSHDLFVAIS